MNNEALTRKQRINSGVDFRTMELRVAVYARVSTDHRDQKSSFEHQLKTYTEMIEDNKNWQFAGAYSDEGITGTRTDIRGGFNQMIMDAKLGKFDLLLVKSVSRFARNMREFMNTISLLTDLGIMVYFEADNINTFADSSRLIQQIVAMAAEMESIAASERTRLSFQQRIQKGKVFGNSKILGYDKDDCKLIINEKEAEVVRTIFDLYVNHSMGGRRIAQELINRGLTRADGKPIPSTAIAGIIDNPKYKGWFCGGKSYKVSMGTRRNRIMNDKDKWVMYRDPNIPAIVSEELWDRAAEIKSNRTTKMEEERKRPRNKGTYPYSGKIIHEDRPNTNFSHVHYDYNYKGKKYTRDAWQCRHPMEGNLGPTLYSDELDKIIMSSIREFLSSYDKIVADMLEMYRKATEINSGEIEIERLEKEKAKIQKSIDKLFILFDSDSISLNEFKERRSTYDKDMSAVNEKIDQIKSNQNNEEVIIEHLEKVKEEMKKSIKAVQPNRELMDNFIERIIVKSTSTKKYIELDVVLKVLPITKSYIIDRKAKREETSDEDLLSAILESNSHDIQAKIDALIALSDCDIVGINKDFKFANILCKCTGLGMCNDTNASKIGNDCDENNSDNISCNCTEIGS